MATCLSLASCTWARPRLFCGQAVSPGQVFQECTLGRLAVGTRLCLLGHPDSVGRSLVVLTRVCPVIFPQFLIFYLFAVMFFFLIVREPLLKSGL